MNTHEISKALRKISPFISNHVFASNQIPVLMNKPIYLISNLDPITKPGSHWIAIYINENGDGEYFDSFGRRPTGFHLNFMKRNSKKWNYNNKIIQNIFSSICGEYCLVFLYLKYRYVSLKDYLNMFDDDTTANDFLLKKMFNSFLYVKFSI